MGARVRRRVLERLSFATAPALYGALWLSGGIVIAPSIWIIPGVLIAATIAVRFGLRHRCAKSYSRCPPAPGLHMAFAGPLAQRD